jgi:hypothetical protein
VPVEARRVPAQRDEPLAQEPAGVAVDDGDDCGRLAGSSSRPERRLLRRGSRSGSRRRGRLGRALRTAAGGERERKDDR